MNQYLKDSEIIELIYVYKGDVAEGVAQTLPIDTGFVLKFLPDYSPRLKAGGSITRFAPSRSRRIPSQRGVHRNTDRGYKIHS